MKIKGLGKDMSKGLRNKAAKQMPEFGISDGVRNPVPKVPMPKYAEGGKVSSFGAAFKAARASGNKEFTFGGKKYTSRLKEESTEAFNKKFAPKAPKVEVEEISAADDNKYQTTDRASDARDEINRQLDQEERQRGDYFSVKDREADENAKSGPYRKMDNPIYLKKGGSVSKKLKKGGTC